jgi:MFS family permease
MKYSWSKTVFPIAILFSFRMLGLFLLIPVFTLYAADLKGASPSLIGLALGAYGLTQGLLQIPFGMLSDRYGRKPIITLGLLLFAFGSLLGALTDSILGMILARTMQGTGAVGSVLIALLADLTTDEQRTKAMAVIGMSIGTSFSLAMVISPAIAAHFGLAGIFYLTLVLALLGLILLLGLIPTPIKERFHSDSEAKASLFKSVFCNRHLQRLNLGIFSQHLILTATFFTIPMILREQVYAGHLTQQWHFYLPLIVGSFLVMVPFIILAEKKKLMKSIFLASVLCMAICQGLLCFYSLNWLALCLSLFFYFVAFNFLEASLPSLISKQANSTNKGTAMGIYSTFQFLGIFVGGSLAGIIYQWSGSQGIFIFNTLIACLWFFIAVFMKPATNLSTLILNYTFSKNNHELLLAELLKVKGVREVAFSEEKGVIYLRVEKDNYLDESAEKIISDIG